MGTQFITVGKKSTEILNVTWHFWVIEILCKNINLSYQARNMDNQLRSDPSLLMVKMLTGEDVSPPPCEENNVS